MRAIKVVLSTIVGAALLFAGVTLVALEGREVVVLRTTGAHGGTRATRIWIADYEGAAWIEAANPDREFYRHILEHPEVELVRNGAARRYHAVPVTGSDGHKLIRSLLAEKYGLADRWIGLLADTSASIAIRLEPRDGGPRGNPS